MVKLNKGQIKALTALKAGPLYRQENGAWAPSKKTPKTKQFKDGLVQGLLKLDLIWFQASTKIYLTASGYRALQ